MHAIEFVGAIHIQIAAADARTMVFTVTGRSEVDTPYVENGAHKKKRERDKKGEKLRFRGPIEFQTC